MGPSVMRRRLEAIIGITILVASTLIQVTEM